MKQLSVTSSLKGYDIDVPPKSAVRANYVLIYNNKKLYMKM